MYMRSDFAALRVRKDVNELSKAKFTCSQAKTRVDFPDGADNMLRLIFTISIADVSGPFANGDFTFFVEIPKTYPFHVWHPNVDMATGKVMMPILGKDWRPPGIDYVLNSTAAEQLHENPTLFKKEVQQILCGGMYYGVEFPCHPRQIEKRRQSWGLRIKRSRDGDSLTSSERENVVSASASANVCTSQGNSEAPALMDFSGASAWKRKRME
ncbi:hypothetical protein BBJ28_00005988 [Nothophytophthora sp. Chile5]|nr:hypothetical protein BBJ28_00005988 [Nothophytophthora sp. Chile5]